MSDREISASDGVRGELTLAICGWRPVAKVYAPDDQQRRPIIPELDDAKLVTMTPVGMLLCGTERAGDGAEYVQEWSVRLASDE